MPRRCLDCGRLAAGTRCTPCHRARRAFRAVEEGRCREAVAAHRAIHGDWCPGWGVPPHASSDLTADHVTARLVGGRLVVLCRSCNGRKGAR